MIFLKRILITDYRYLIWKLVYLNKLLYIYIFYIFLILTKISKDLRMISMTSKIK